MRAYLPEDNIIVTGKIVKEQWMLEGYEAVDRKGFLVPLLAMDAGTLLPIVQPWVMSDSIIQSDMWQACNQLGALGYEHEMVNHSLFCGLCHRGSHQSC